MKAAQTERCEFSFQERLFFLAILFLPFIHLPKIFTVPLPGAWWGHLSAYPLVLGGSLWLTNILKKRDWPISLKGTSFLLVYTMWINIVTVVGLYYYPYFDYLDINQFNKLKNINVHIIELIKTYIPLHILFSVKITIVNFINLVMTIGISVWVYALFKNRKFRGLLLFRKGILCSFFIVGAYSVIEIAYLLGNQLAMQILTMINPWLFLVKDNGTWYPPLLWPGQVRSICAEPSFLGIYLAVALPFAISNLFEKAKAYRGMVAVIFYMIFLIFLTKSRTALVLFIVQSILVFGYLSFSGRKDLKRILSQLLVAVFLAVLASNTFSYLQALLLNNNIELSQAAIAKAGIIETVSTIVERDSRSNNSRYAVQVADLRLGMAHPIFGVGVGLSAFYLENYIPEWAHENQEIQGWINAKQGISVLNLYTRYFAERGLGGVVLSIVPLTWFLWKNSCVLKYKSRRKVGLQLALFLASLGLSLAYATTSDGSNYALYMLLGFF